MRASGAPTNSAFSTIWLNAASGKWRAGNALSQAIASNTVCTFVRHGVDRELDEALGLGQRGEHAQHGLALAHLAAADQVAHELDVLGRRHRGDRRKHERSTPALVDSRRRRPCDVR